MGWIKKAWAWLNGKKTVLGMVAVVVAKAGKALKPGLPVWELLDQAGTALGAVGVTHKVAKAATEDSGASKEAPAPDTPEGH